MATKRHAACEEAVCGRLEQRLSEEIKQLGLHDAGTMEAELAKSLSHGRQVCRLLRALFDGLKSVHGLDDHWRTTFCLAAMLHDIGQIAGMKGHHKHSCRLLLGKREDVAMTSVVAGSLEGLLHCVPDEERGYVALLARYHRKVWPGTAQKGYRRLSLPERQAVTVGSALLRVADGLDMSHDCVVEHLEIEMDKKNVILLLYPRPDADEKVLAADALRAVQKGQLFCGVFGRNLKWQQR